MGARRSGGGGCALQTLVARDLQAGQAGPEHLSFFGLFLSSSTSDSVPLLTYRNSSDLYLAVLSLLSGAIKSTTKHLCSCLFSWLLIKLPPAASAHPAQPEALMPLRHRAGFSPLSAAKAAAAAAQISEHGP